MGHDIIARVIGCTHDASFQKKYAWVKIFVLDAGVDEINYGSSTCQSGALYCIAFTSFMDEQVKLQTSSPAESRVGRNKKEPISMYPCSSKNTGSAGLIRIRSG